MKILLIGDGRDAHTQRWARYFSDRRNETHLVTYDPMGVTIDGVTEHVLHTPVKNLYLAFGIYHVQIMRLVRKIRPDIIHAHFIAKYGFHLPFLFRHPVVVSAWGDDILILPKKSAFLRFFTGKVLACADLVYAVSQDIRNHIVSDFTIPEDKVVWIPFGVDTDQFSPGTEREMTGENKIIIFSNRKFFPVYDYPTLIEGFRLAYRKNPNLRLVIRGEGPEEGKIHSLITASGLSPAVTFLKRTEYSQVPGDLRKSDIFVSTSLSDGTPVSLLEAMATGLPCIATRVGGVPEWIDDGRNGLLIRPRDPDGLAEKLLMLAGSAPMRSCLAKAARDTVVSQGEWTTLMKRVEDDYNRLVRQHSS